MHHYEAEMTTLSTAAGGKNVPVRSGYRCNVVVAGDQHGGMVEFEAPTELPAGATKCVRLTFTFPESACPMIKEGEIYPVMEGSRDVGSLRILADAWKRIDDVIRVGDVVTAVVIKTDWTLASIALPRGGTSSLRSADVGLRPWDDISDKLQTGDVVTVRVQDIDRTSRRITVEAVDKQPRTLTSSNSWSNRDPSAGRPRHLWEHVERAPATPGSDGVADNPDEARAW